MRVTRFLGAGLTLALLSGCSFQVFSTGSSGKEFRLESSAFRDRKDIPEEHTCDGDGISPPLTIRNPPAGTRSMALVVDDPDADPPYFVHWLVWGIDPDVKSIEAGGLPPTAIQGTTGAKTVGFVPPCPPPGETHRYYVRLYALNTTIDLSHEATRSRLEQEMKGHVLAIAELLGVVEREEED